jgi:hypothetical protein
MNQDNILTFARNASKPKNQAVAPRRPTRLKTNKYTTFA